MPLWRKIEEEKGEVDVPPPFWAFAWAGGQAIARYLLDHPEEVDGKRVLDFGAGSGLCAIAAMKAGAVHALAADIDVFCRQALIMNARANGVRVSFTGRDLLDDDPPQVDVILAGDIWYEQPLAARVLPWLQAAQARGIRILLGDPGRAYVPPDGIVRLAEYQVPATRDLEGVEIKRTGVLSLSVSEPNIR